MKSFLTKEMSEFLKKFEAKYPQKFQQMFNAFMARYSNLVDEYAQDHHINARINPDNGKVEIQDKMFQEEWKYHQENLTESVQDMTILFVAELQIQEVIEKQKEVK